jgi:hypothetical protein
MSRSALLRYAGIANIIGGISIAIFVIEHPWGRFFGAEVGLTRAWAIAHGFHLLGATFSLLGIVGLYLLQADKMGRFGFWSFVLSFVGTAWFVGTGLITAFIWPMLAAVAPEVVAAGGAIVAPPALIAFGSTALMLSLGYLLFCAASWRLGILPPWALALWAVGAVLGVIPPTPVGPLPWFTLVFGGIIYGIGAVGLGRALWQAADQSG